SRAPLTRSIPCGQWQRSGWSGLPDPAVRPLRGLPPVGCAAGRGRSGVSGWPTKTEYYIAGYNHEALGGGCAGRIPASAAPIRLTVAAGILTLLRGWRFAGAVDASVP